ncbi:PELOTA RNA binding domain-containing protein [Duganella sp. CF517]|uniref:cysteine protease StiP family protein n=1 Tax=Duganella sp. CF517 TaxID=1881038 RepID=UPI0008B8CE4F|nr:cysteine protease StiP family protein [Duganella sp. CF517]SEN19984.1 PELOTA RNA binding domain-containing protein [Duganella sp. CF517]
MNFSGSYHGDDVRFLLKPLALASFVDVPDKERLIQSGQRHYSEMLSRESLPSPRYLDVFGQACAANLQRMARDCVTLAGLIARRRAGPVTLVSLARAGTPVGVVLKRLLGGVFGREVAHYSLSIIRDRGIDQVALEYILAQGHAPESIVFVDGWTGKGVIAAELHASMALFNARHGCAIDSGLYVLSDLAGVAACAAGHDDYLIPSSILNATVSGLVSRSILNDAIGPDDFHGCVYYAEFEPQDQSRAFADRLVELARQWAEGPAAIDAVIGPASEPASATTALADLATETARATAAQVSRGYMRTAKRAHGVADRNLIKPGLGEATRVLLRRSPDRLIVRDAASADVAHLLVLAREKDVPVQLDPELPYQAVSIIRSIADG